jgi:broad specificity phosphatase PhoE
MAQRRLTLIRHGRSSYVHPGGLQSRADMVAWRRGYDAAGILASDTPPPALRELVRGTDLIVASDLPRAVMTAERLADGRQVVLSPLIREAPAPWPAWNRARLPRVVWEWAVTLRWGYYILRNIDIPPQDLERGSKAAFWIDDLMKQHVHGAIVTHGVFRRILARQLEALGWQSDGRRRSYDHWSVWTLTR